MYENFRFIAIPYVGANLELIQSIVILQYYMFGELVYENFRFLAIPYAGANLELTQAIGMYEQDQNCS